MRACPADVQPVGVRELRAEGGKRAVGSPIAVRGVAILHLMLVPSGSEGPPEGSPDGKCHRYLRSFTLATENGDPCLSMMIDTPDHLNCRGDRTDTCCSANPALPRQGSVAVAVGRYRGTLNFAEAQEADRIEVDYFCTPPAATKEPSDP